MSARAPRWFVGCACDRKFVRHTSVMLTSLAVNGDVPEATILVAAFGLVAEDYDTIRAHTGAIGDRVRFVDVTPAMLETLSGRDWEPHYPLAVLGRLFLPNAIDVEGARLLTLDSDMIVNTSVRPLLEADMAGDYLGAIHDTPRDDDYDYFNSGMMVIDVDTFRHYDVGARALQWLAERTERPQWPDQDALNTVVGHKWHRFERRWNWAYCGERWGDAQLEAHHYENASIAHFTGQGKPWDRSDHPGRQLYLRYAEDYRERATAYHLVMDSVDANFVATTMEVLLGREPRDARDLAGFTGATTRETIQRIAGSSEFAAHTLLSVKLGAPFPAGHFHIPPTLRHRRWAAQRLWIGNQTAQALLGTTTWREMLSMLLRDRDFCASAGIEPLLALAERVAADPAMIGQSAPV